MPPVPGNDDTDCRFSPLECFVPRGGVRSFVNATSATTRTPAMLTPGLIGPAYVREMAVLLAACGPPDAAEVAEVMGRHGLVITWWQNRQNVDKSRWLRMCSVGS